MNYDKALSAGDIYKLMNNKVNIVSYKDIHKFNNINELLEPYGKCILLYHTKKNYGHWVCLYENDHKTDIFFFDSYGFKPDTQLKYIHNSLKKELNHDYNYLIKLLYDSNKNIFFNEYKLQKVGKNIKTCGLWVVLRLKYKDISIKNFNKIMNSTKYTPDELILKLFNENKL